MKDGCEVSTLDEHHRVCKACSDVDERNRAQSVFETDVSMRSLTVDIGRTSDQGELITGCAQRKGLSCGQKCE